MQSEIFGLGILQVLNANAFIGSGWVRVKLGAEKGGMTRWHTKASFAFVFKFKLQSLTSKFLSLLQFLFPQALGCIAIMGATVFAPQWMRVSCLLPFIASSSASQKLAYPSFSALDSLVGAKPRSKKKFKGRKGFFKRNARTFVQRRKLFSKFRIVDGMQQCYCSGKLRMRCHLSLASP